jgi:hypothetical protein
LSSALYLQAFAPLPNGPVQLRPSTLLKDPFPAQVLHQRPGDLGGKADLKPPFPLWSSKTPPEPCPVALRKPRTIPISCMVRPRLGVAPAASAFTLDTLAHFGHFRHFRSPGLTVSRDGPIQGKGRPLCFSPPVSVGSVGNLSRDRQIQQMARASCPTANGPKRPSSSRVEIAYPACRDKGRKPPAPLPTREAWAACRCPAMAKPDSAGGLSKSLN